MSGFPGVKFGYNSWNLIKETKTSTLILEPFFAMWSYMRPPCDLQKTVSADFEVFDLDPKKLIPEQYSRTKNDCLFKPVGFQYLLALFWQPKPFLTSKKHPTCNTYHFSINIIYFWPKFQGIVSVRFAVSQVWGPKWYMFWKKCDEMGQVGSKISFFDWKMTSVACCRFFWYQKGSRWSK